MSKSSRIAALESRMTAVEQHCGIAPPADPAPVPLTADDSYNGEVNIQYPPTPEPLGPLSDESKAKLRAHEAARKASATLAVGDTVETLDRARLADNTICAASPAPGAVGTVEAITTAVDGKPYKVRFSTGSPDYWYYPASSLRRVQPAPDVQPAAGYVVSCMRHGTRNCPDCFGIAAPAARVPSPTCGTCHGRWNHCPDCTPAEQPAPLKGEKYP